MLAEICRDLGLKPDWAALSTQPWACTEIELGEKSKDDCLHEEAGWPLKGGPPPPPPTVEHLNSGWWPLLSDRLAGGVCVPGADTG